MLMAILRGKLSREQENMEDVLTSNVFGLLRYLAPEEGLLPFLQQAKSSDGEKPFEDLTSVDSVGYEFWRWYEEGDCIGCEPDVVLRMDEPSGRKWIVLIEAKYRSGKSSEADDALEDPYDQLAREWDNLTHIAEHEHAVSLLIYLTADIGCPREDIEKSKDEYESKRSGLPQHRPFRCAWLSWRHLIPALEKSTGPIVEDLRALNGRLGLIFFGGISPIEHIGPITWQFKESKATFHWHVLEDTDISWRFVA